MNYSQRVQVLSELGNRFSQANAEMPQFQEAFLANQWFTIDMQLRAIHAWGKLLNPENIQQWLQSYLPLEPSEPKIVTLIMAGNIPLVGLHDLLSVFITGHYALIKTSSDDTVLMKWVVAQLTEIDSEMERYLKFSEGHQMKNFDAVIATGSNNSNRYFEYYFKHKPNILRSNRSSLAILTGNETVEELDLLADDVFQFFGLGCRNVTKLLLPHGYNVEPLFLAFERYKDIINHNKYANNYTYHKAIFLMNMQPHLDNNFVLLKQDDGLTSPLSVLMFQFFDGKADIEQYISTHQAQIQCVVGEGYVPFGQSQQPALWDYADGVDTIKFLKELN